MIRSLVRAGRTPRALAAATIAHRLALLVFAAAALACAGWPAPAAAQGGRAPEVIVRDPAAGTAWLESYGFKFGLSAARFHGSFARGLADQRLYRFASGVQASFRLTRDLSFAPELLYSERGGKGAIALATTSQRTVYEVTYRLEYIEIPLLLRVSSARSGWTPFLVVGPSIAFKTAGQVSLEETSVTPIPPGPVQFANIFEGIGTFDGQLDRFDDVDFGATFGGGAILGSGPVRLLVEGRYMAGLTNMLPSDLPDAEARHGIASAMVGLEYRR